MKFIVQLNKTFYIEKYSIIILNNMYIIYNTGRQYSDFIISFYHCKGPSTQHQSRDDASDTVLIENNGVA